MHKQMIHSHSRSPRRLGQGFTIMELLVAVVITLIIISVAGVLLHDSSEAVGVGVAHSNVMGSARAASEQFYEDAKYMVGPGGLLPFGDGNTHRYSPGKGGIIIITNKRYTGVPITLPGRGETTEDIRSDGLYFIRESAGSRALAPENTNTFANSKSAPFMLVSYSHGLKVNANGTDPSSTVLGNAGINALASSWVLTRHALHLYEADDFPPIHAVGPQSNASIVGVSGEARYRGITDVARTSLHEPFSHAAVNNSPNGLLIGAQTSTALLRANMAKATYDTAAMNLSFHNQRLRVNNGPTQSGTTSFPAWQVGQMHSYFVGNVSDFIVEFAADTDASGSVDTDSDGIIWYSMDSSPAPSFSSGGRLPNGSNYNPAVTSGLGGNADQAWVFRHDDYARRTNASTGELESLSYWPHMIRIRYRVHDGRGRLSSEEGKSGRWFEQTIIVTRP